MMTVEQRDILLNFNIIEEFDNEKFRITKQFSDILKSEYEKTDYLIYAIGNAVLFYCKESSTQEIGIIATHLTCFLKDHDSLSKTQLLKEISLLVKPDDNSKLKYEFDTTNERLSKRIPK